MSDERFQECTRIVLGDRDSPVADLWRHVAEDLLMEVNRLKEFVKEVMIDQVKTTELIISLSLIDTTTLQVRCSSCQTSPRHCDATGCGGRRHVGWRSEQAPDSLPDDDQVLSSRVLDPFVLSLLDAVAHVSLAAMSRGEAALKKEGLDVPPLLVAIVRLLGNLADQTTDVMELPHLVLMDRPF
jgi:hypothetical protein